MMKVTAKELEDLIIVGLETALENNDFPAADSIRSFDSVGMLTRNNGVVLRIAGLEFQITIVRSK